MRRRSARPGSAAPLPPDEAQHLIRVLRLSIGETVRVFDGRGREHLATVEAMTKSDAIVRLGEAAAPAPESPVAITLAMALLKADKFDEVVRDATMLGVSRIQPIATTRTEVPAARTSRVDRWRRIAVSSAEAMRARRRPAYWRAGHLLGVHREAGGGAAADAGGARPEGGYLDASLWPPSPRPQAPRCSSGPKAAGPKRSTGWHSTATRPS